MTAIELLILCNSCISENSFNLICDEHDVVSILTDCYNSKFEYPDSVLIKLGSLTDEWMQEIGNVTMEKRKLL